MKKIWWIVSLACSVVFYAAAYQWPLEEIVLKKTFGEMKDRNFSCGILLGGAPQDVSAVEAGEVLFVHREEGDLSGIPSGLGNFIILEHERSLVSLYAHLDSLDGALYDGGSLGSGGYIGRTGSSGEAPGTQLYLEIVDKEFDRMVNPLHLLPPLNDSLSPVIEEVRVRMEESFSLEEVNSLPSGEGELYVTLYDPSQFLQFFRPMAPYRINIFANGEELFYQTFEAIEAREGTLMLVSQREQRSFNALYADKNQYRVGTYTFNPGETILEVIVSDFFGNETAKTYRLRILAGS